MLPIWPSRLHPLSHEPNDTIIMVSSWSWSLHKLMGISMRTLILGDILIYASFICMWAVKSLALRIDPVAFLQGFCSQACIFTCTILFLYSSFSPLVLSSLAFHDTVTHLGHLLSYNLSDMLDINYKLKDMVSKANCLITSFPGIGPSIRTRLLQSYFLSLMVCAFGHSLLQLSTILRLPLTGSCTNSGTSVIIVTW